MGNSNSYSSGGSNSKIKIALAIVGVVGVLVVLTLLYKKFNNPRSTPEAFTNNYEYMEQIPANVNININEQQIQHPAIVMHPEVAPGPAPLALPVTAPIHGSVPSEDGTAQPAEQDMDMQFVLDRNAPYVDPTSGILMHGPGFPTIDRVNQQIQPTIPPDYYFLDDGAGGELGIQYNLCSKSCCSDQWPTPFKQKFDPYVCGNKDKFVPSNIYCNNSFQDSGCLCMTKDQAKFLYNRGGNGRESF